MLDNAEMMTGVKCERRLFPKMLERYTKDGGRAELTAEPIMPPLDFV
jgi:hypothetical protein